MAEVSVIVPVYNGADLIADALDSVFAQTASDYEVIVVNDGSEDGTSNALGPYMHRISYFQHEQNRGPSAARNTGIRHASGEYVAFLDADDVWMPPKLERQLTVFRQNPNVDLVYTHYLRMAADRQPLKWGKRRLRELARKRRSDDIFRTLIDGNFIDQVTPVCRYASLEKVGPYDQLLRRLEDWDMWLRMAYQGQQFHYLDEPTAAVRARAGSLTSDSRAMCASRLRVLQKALSWPGLSQNRQRHIERAYARALVEAAGFYYKCGEHTSYRDEIRRCWKLDRSALHLKSVRRFLVSTMLEN